MKIRKSMKKRKIVVTACCIAALIGGMCIYGAVQPDTVQAGTAAAKSDRMETDAANKDAPEEKEQAEEKRRAEDKSEKEQKAEEKMKSAASGNKGSAAISSGSQNNGSDRNSSAGASEQKNPAESTQPAHEHDWKAIEVIQEVEKEVPIFGDKCNTCGKNITGFAENHILETGCMGYSTDVIVGYEYEKVREADIAGHSCICGARK